MRCSKTGRAVELMQPGARGNTSYQLWRADEFECDTCNARVVVNWASKPTEHFEPGYQYWLDSAPDRIQVVCR